MDVNPTTLYIVALSYPWWQTCIFYFFNIFLFVFLIYFSYLFIMFDVIIIISITAVSITVITIIRAFYLCGAKVPRGRYCSDWHRTDFGPTSTTSYRCRFDVDPDSICCLGSWRAFCWQCEQLLLTLAPSRVLCI